MKKFIVLYHSPADAMEQTMNATPEQMAEGMKMWTNWAQKTGDKLVEMGSPLANGQQIRMDGTVKNSDKNVSGYSIIQAESMEDAKALFKGHPHLGWNPDAYVEIHETMQIPGM